MAWASIVHTCRADGIFVQSWYFGMHLFINMKRYAENNEYTELTNYTKCIILPEILKYSSVENTEYNT